MKRVHWLTILGASLLLASDARAQQLQQPGSVRQVAFGGYYAIQDVESSPSDMPATLQSSDVVSADASEDAATSSDAAMSVEVTGGTAHGPATSSLIHGAGCGCGSAASFPASPFSACTGGCTNSGCTSCDSDDCNKPWTLFPNDNCLGITAGGWLQLGYHDESNGMFNSHPNNLNVHQLWMYVEKVADGSQGLDWGFRFDGMYGVDAQDTQAFGNNPGRWDFLNGYDHGIYGWALPQLYGEVAVGDLSVKFGHFFTIVGYEVVPSPGNFFYSHAYTMYNSEPFTHTGILGTYQMSDALTLYGGWTLGWDTGFDQLGDGNNFLGGFSLSLSDSITMTYVNTIGDMGDFNLGGRGEGYSHSLVIDTALTENLNYIFQTDMVSLDTGAVDHNDEVGINQYLIYKINDCWSYGSRLEWWKSDRGFDYGGQAVVPLGSHSYYGYTSGINYKPTANLTLRPEFRQDWSPAADYDQTTFGVDAVWTY